MIKKSLKALGKTVVAGIIAFVILTLFGFFYYNEPVASANKDGSTDYRREANVLYFYATEGFGQGKTNNDGFSNMFDYDDEMKIDILIMGSSHMEAYQVDMRQSTASRLNALLDNKTVYNIGFSGHKFLTCASNLKAALKTYRPTNYVVIVTSSVSFSDEEIALAIDGETPDLPSNAANGGIIGLLRKNPYLHLIKRQMDFYLNDLQAEDIEDAEAPEAFAESDSAVNESLLSDLLHKMSVSAEEYGAKLIIAYHPGVKIASDGALILNADQDAIARFKRSCDANGILFLDMSDRFKEEYENTYILPYGFANSPVGSGHLNQYGHAMMAEELYQLILEDEQ